MRISAHFGENMHDRISSLLRYCSWIVALNIVGGLVLYGLNIFLAQFMGVKQYGIYIYVLTWITIISLLSRIGFDTVLMKYVTAYFAQGKFRLLKGIIRQSHTFVLLMSLITSGLMGLIVWIIQDRLSIDLRNTFWVGCAVLPFFSLNGIRQSILLSLKHVISATFPEKILWPSLLVLYTILGSFVLNKTLGGSEVMALTLISVVIASGVGFVWMLKHVPKALNNITPEFRSLEWFKVAYPLFLVSGAQILLAKTDIVMLGMLVSPEEAGKYSVAYSLAILVSFFIGSANQVIAPTISELFVKKRYVDLQQIITNSARVLLILTVPVVLVLLVFGRQLLGIFGEEFIEVYHVVSILIIGQFYIVLGGSVGFLMTMTEHQQTAAWIIGIVSILNVLLNAILIPSLGITGAAIATSICVILRSTILGYFVWRKLGIMPTFLGPQFLSVIKKFQKETVSGL